MRTGVVPLLLALVGTIGLAGPSSAGHLPKEREWAFPQAFIMTRAYGTLNSCAKLQDAYAAKGWPQGRSLDTLRAIDKRLKSSVFLRPDTGADTWTPLAADLLTLKRRPAADCDDVSITSVQFAVCAGFPAQNLGVMITQYPGRAREMHMVAFYDDPQSDIWIFGDTMGRPRPLSQLNQKLHYFAYLTDITRWWALTDPETGKPLSQDLPTSSIPGPGDTLDLEQGSCRADRN